MSRAALAALVAARTLGRDVAAVTGVTDIKHGLTNQSWLVHVGGETLVVRLSDAPEDALQIDRDSEARILSAVAAVGIGPCVLHCDPRRHVLVTRYLGPTWSFEEAGEEYNIDRLAALLRRLHGLAPPASVRRIDLTATVDGYLRTLDEHAAAGALALRPLRTRARQVADCLHRDAAARLCHNDVHHLNVVEVPGAGALRLIDWEYAGIGEPMFDLASACVYHRHDQARRQRLLASYLGSPEPAAWHRLELACWLFEYVRELWTAVRELAA